MIIEAVPKEKRDISADEFIAAIEGPMAQLDGFQKLRFQKSRWGQDSGSAIELLVQQNDDGIRHQVVEGLAAAMRDLPGLKNVEADEGLRVPEYRVRVNGEMSKRLAISPADISATFRTALEGTVLYEFFDGDQDIYVRLTTVDDAKRDMEKVLALPVENQRNYMVPLSSVVSVVLLIYLILAILFESLWKPVVIMLAIPFGLAGVILAFYAHGKSVYGFYAVIGCLGLAGVVVNDAIIMLVKLDEDFDTTRPRSEIDAQVARISQTRLRAVLLTTLTTVAGILPTAYGWAGYDAMLAEMMLALAYSVRPAFDADRDAPGTLSLTLSQAVARNAFGRSTRLLDRLIGLEVEVAQHQVVEAYEDYLAGLMAAYYDWWAAYENLQISQSSYQENLRLLDNILERQKQQVALPLDVNKTRLQVLAKQEDLIDLADAYTNALQVIETAVRHTGPQRLLPQADDPLALPEAPVDEILRQVRKESRTFQILDLLEERSDLDLDRQADDLLPSIDLLFALEADGNDHDLKDSEQRVSLGIALEWPFPDQVDRAEHEVAKINLARSRLATENTRQRLNTRLKNLYLQIQRERALTAIADEKIGLARSVLADETVNYSYGRVTLNDYIQAVNVLDNNRFSRLRHNAREKILTLEWLRLTDRLITRGQIPPP